MIYMVSDWLGVCLLWLSCTALLVLHYTVLLCQLGSADSYQSPASASLAVHRQGVLFLFLLATYKIVNKLSPPYLHDIFTSNTNTKGRKLVLTLFLFVFPYKFYLHSLVS